MMTEFENTLKEAHQYYDLFVDMAEAYRPNIQSGVTFFYGDILVFDEYDKPEIYEDIILLGDLIDKAQPGEEIDVTGIFIHNYGVDELWQIVDNLDAT
jgi:hypothetical protein